MRLMLASLCAMGAFSGASMASSFVVEQVQYRDVRQGDIQALESASLYVDSARQALEVYQGEQALSALSQASDRLQSMITRRSRLPLESLRAAQRAISDGNMNAAFDALQATRARLVEVRDILLEPAQPF